jgi:hypothetical protein
MKTIQIDFTEKEIQVIQLIVPEMTPTETCNKVLRDWFNSNLQRFPQQTKTSEQMIDEIIAVGESNKLLAPKDVV